MLKWRGLRGLVELRRGLLPALLRGRDAVEVMVPATTTHSQALGAVWVSVTGNAVLLLAAREFGAQLAQLPPPPPPEARAADALDRLMSVLRLQAVARGAVARRRRRLAQRRPTRQPSAGRRASASAAGARPPLAPARRVPRRRRTPIENFTLSKKRIDVARQG